MHWAHNVLKYKAVDALFLFLPSNTHGLGIRHNRRTDTIGFRLVKSQIGNLLSWEESSQFLIQHSSLEDDIMYTHCVILEEKLFKNIGESSQMIFNVSPVQFFSLFLNFNLNDTQTGGTQFCDMVGLSDKENRGLIEAKKVQSIFSQYLQSNRLSADWEFTFRFFPRIIHHLGFFR